MRAIDARAALPFLARRLRGQGLMEYGMIISLISLFAIVSLTLFGQSFSSMLGNTGGLASYLSNP